jgi:hypothetical protein
MTDTPIRQPFSALLYKLASILLGDSVIWKTKLQIIRSNLEMVEKGSSPL